MDRRINTRQRRGILWIASYPKSGNTWVRAFLEALGRVILGEGDRFDINRLEHASVGDRAIEDYAPYVQGEITDARRPEIAAARPRLQAAIARHRGLKIAKTHNALVSDHGHPLINPSATAGAIYIVRNPLDVAVSFARFRNVDVGTIISDMADAAFGRETGRGDVYYLAGSWSGNVRSWTTGTHAFPVHVARYEDMLADPAASFRAIADKVVVGASDDHVAQAIELASFDSLKRAEQTAGFVEKADEADAFFREGRSGQWRDVLLPAEVDRIVADHGSEMERFGYLP